ncbi:hypothetical protein BH11ARM2_BH11ARM2_28490 [soil metagenome]
MRSVLVLALAILTVASADAQAWQKFYDEGLNQAKEGKWKEARDSFLSAVEARPEDSSKPTPLFGPITERRTWRNGAPYSANLLAAYCGVRAAGDLTGEEKSKLLDRCAVELERLVDKNQAGQVAALTLVEVYNALGDVQRRARLQQRAGVPNPAWREDLEIVLPGTVPGSANTAQPLTNPGTITNPPTKNPPDISTQTSDPKIAPPPTNPQGTRPDNGVPPIVGGVATLPNKYALIIGNRESQLPGGKIPYAEDDAIRVREAIQNYAGYEPGNVETVLNGTAEGIKAAAAALAGRMVDGGTILIYFTGVGTNLGGKDYLAGADTELPSDVGSMLSKEDLYRYFYLKGANIFAFFQADRPVINTRCFGTEIPAIGSLSQMQATLPDGKIQYLYQGGRPVGLFTNAFVRALEKFKTNQVPISEFGWAVFYGIRSRDDTTTQSTGSSLQTPTVPTRVGMSADARF